MRLLVSLVSAFVACCAMEPALAQTLDANTPDKRKTVIVNNTCETVDEWTYNPCTGQFMTTLRFESGKLVAITYGDRVK